MDSTSKRRARFKKGVTPPPLEPPKKLSWFEEYNLRQEQRKQRQEERLRNRKPIPELDAIGAQFVESTLLYFARAKPKFWEDSVRRFFYNRSDFLSSLRLGQHLDSFDKVLGICRKTQFPSFRLGKVEIEISESDGNGRKLKADLYYQLAEGAEWEDALAEVQGHLGIDRDNPPPSKDAQRLIEFAETVSMGTSKTMPKEQHSDWNVWECQRAVSEAQVVDSRLSYHGETYANSTITVSEKPMPWLVLPSLDACLDFPVEATKVECDALSRRIEQTVQLEHREGRLTAQWLVLVRTKSRQQALRSFGHLDNSELAAVAHKSHPVGMVLWWDFSSDGRYWILSVRPQDGMTWFEVTEAIQEKAVEVPSVEKHKLSKEAAALFDWLRQLPREKMEWGLSPELTDEVLKSEIGIENPWSHDNDFLFFNLLAGEIIRQTPYLALAHPWKHYATINARIEFRPK